MSSQLLQLLNQWYPERDAIPWVLGTVYKTQGHCYRKAGAMMLFNGLGQKFGLLSGGCLESDLQQHARRLMQTGGAVCLSYDAADEDDLAFRLGIGCGGKVYILLQAIRPDNDYLHLSEVRAHLLEKREVYYWQMVPEDDNRVSRASNMSVSAESLAAITDENRCSLACLTSLPNTHAIVDLFAERFDDIDSFMLPPAKAGIYSTHLIEGEKGCCLMTCLSPPLHLLIVGGGADAMPVASIAHQLGWHVTVADHRPANARAEFFPDVTVLRDTDADMLSYAQSQHVDAAILMSHSVSIDARGLKLLQQVARLRYMALLGPVSRRQKVLEQAALTESDLCIPLSGPAGFDLAANSPESIALSILCECHARLYQGSGQPLS